MLAAHLPVGNDERRRGDTALSPLLLCILLTPSLAVCAVMARRRECEPSFSGCFGASGAGVLRLFSCACVWGISRPLFLRIPRFLVCCSRRLVRWPLFGDNIRASALRRLFLYLPPRLPVGAGQRRERDISKSLSLLCILPIPSPPFAPLRRADVTASHDLQGVPQQAEQGCSIGFAYACVLRISRCCSRRPL